MYLLSCTLKRFEDDGMPADDLPLVQYAVKSGLYEIQKQLDGVLANLPLRPMAWLLRLIAFPLGCHRRPPSDKLTRACASLLLSPSDARDRLTAGMYVSHKPDDATGRLEAALIAALARDRIEDKVRAAGGSKALHEGNPAKWLDAKLITQEEANALSGANKLIHDAIMVDDFAPEELTRAKQTEPKPSRDAAE